MGLDRRYAILVGDASKKSALELVMPLLDGASTLLVAGKLGRAFMMCFGYEQDDEEIDEGTLALAYKAITYAREHGIDLELPLDYVLVDNPVDTGSVATADYDEIPSGATIVDIGLSTLMRYEEVINAHPGVIIAGCITGFDNPIFRLGTNYIQRFLLEGYEGEMIIIGDDAIDAFKGLANSGKARIFHDGEHVSMDEGGV